MLEGIVRQMRTRLLSVSATASTLPSVATAVGVRMPFALMLYVVLLKSGCPSTSEAEPTQIGQGLAVSAKFAVGWGIAFERPVNISTRLLFGVGLALPSGAPKDPKRLESATNSVSAP